MISRYYFLCCMLFIFCEANSQVKLPYYEGFNYSIDSVLIKPGTNSGFGGWTIPSFQTAGSSPDPYIIASPNWKLPANLPSATGNALEFIGSGDDPIITIPDQDTTGIIYSSFMFRASDFSAVTVNNPVYFYSFAKVASSGTSLNYTSCVYIRKVSDSTFDLGISENNNTTNAVWSSTPLDINADFFIVISYDIDNATSYMWINPVINGTQPSTVLVTNETATSKRTNLTMVRLNLDSNAKTPKSQMDEIRIGKTWASVTQSTTSGVDFDVLSGVKLYPNPVRDNLFISSDDFPAASISIYSVNGQEVLNQKDISNNRVDVSNLSPGNYIVKLFGSGKIVSLKMIKE
ncbi:MAG: T9SS type A sorting domain-containing protein [Saprospiraceae bacterium]|nr:T9SS type A sorting domain-containing protein [Saprospiraceae bacterium]